MGRIKEKSWRGGICVLILSSICGCKPDGTTKKSIKNILRYADKFQVLRGISTERQVQGSRHFTISLKPLLMLRVVV
jgi:hypothetical protein